MPGDLAIVGAATLAEAESLLLSIALEVSTRRDVLVVADDRRRIDSHLLAIAANVRAEAVESNHLTRAERAALLAVRQTIGDRPIDVMTTKMAKDTTGEIRSWLRAHSGGLVVLPAAWPTSLVADSEQAESFIRDLKDLARSTGGTIAIPWWLRARAARNAQLADLSNAGVAEGDSDLVILVGHDVMGDVEDLRIAKNRHGECGVLWSIGDSLKVLPDPIDPYRVF